MSTTATVDLVAASGGYMIACAASRLIAAPFAIVGSIGVAATAPNVARLLDKQGVDVVQRTAGEYKVRAPRFAKQARPARSQDARAPCALVVDSAH